MCKLSCRRRRARLKRWSSLQGLSLHGQNGPRTYSGRLRFLWAPRFKNIYFLLYTAIEVSFTTYSIFAAWLIKRKSSPQRLCGRNKFLFLYLFYRPAQGSILVYHCIDPKWFFFFLLILFNCCTHIVIILVIIILKGHGAVPEGKRLW